MSGKIGFWRSLLAASVSGLAIVALAGPGGGGCGGGGGSTGTGSSSSSGGASTTGGSSSSGSASEPYSGSVTLGDGVTGAKDVLAEFLATADASAVTCSGGATCCYTPPPATSSSGGSLTTYGAGTITVTDSGSTIDSLTYSGGLYVPSTTAPVWNPGDSLTVSASGATVDAFTATVKAPGILAGLAPALSFTSAISIPLASNWSIAWTPDTASGENVILSISAITSAEASAGDITCTVPDSAGTVSVPSALLGNFATGEKATVILTRYAGANATDANAVVHVLVNVEAGGSAMLQ
jgi:hypothetical protein